MTDKNQTNPILIDIPMPIETPRLVLRGVRAGDGEVLYKSKLASRTELQRWMPWAKEIGSEEDTEIVIRENEAKFLTREDLMIVGFSKETGEHIISTGLHRIDWTLRIFEIGFWVSTPYTKKGYASESTNALIRYAFEALSASKVIICHSGGNDASRRVIEKLGFEKEGVFKKDDHLPDGTITDKHWYARFNTDGLPDLDARWGPA